MVRLPRACAQLGTGQNVRLAEVATRGIFPNCTYSSLWRRRLTAPDVSVNTVSVNAIAESLQRMVMS